MSVTDLSGVIDSLSPPQLITVTRYPSSNYTDGRLDEAVPLPDDEGVFQIRANVQPASGRDMKLLPEGKQTEEALSVWTQVELFTVGGTHGADILSIDGNSWEVHKVERWSKLGNYWRAVVVRVENEGT